MNTEELNFLTVTNLVTVVLVLKKLLTMKTTLLLEAIIGYDVRDQQTIDRAMIALDGTLTKGKLRTETPILGVSIAVAH